VATPIGNLGDITTRGLEVLRAVDRIAAEDTRVTARLLAHFGIEKPLVVLHRHNERQGAARVIAALEAGEAVAYVSDAGSPSLADPGAGLVTAARAASIEIVAIPGASALTAAWSVSGLAGPGFLFHGFLPNRGAERRSTLQGLAHLPYALVFYEAPHRVLEAVRDLADLLGPHRTLVIARELTKLHESVHACPLGDAHAWLAADSNRQRGEFVLIVSGADRVQTDTEALGETALRALIEDLAPARAARLAARISGAPRGPLYDLAVKLREAAGRSTAEPDES